VAPLTGRWLRDDQHALFLAGMAWVLTVLMIVPDGLDYASLSASAAPASGSALSRALWLGLLAGGLLVIAWRAGMAWLLLRWLNPFLLAMVALAVASVAWSIEPSLSLRRSIRVVTIVVVCIAFVLASWHQQRYQNVMRPILTIVLVASLAFGLASPSLAIHQETSAELLGAWRGITNHKNSLGALACMGLIFWAHAWLSREVRPLGALAGAMVALACLVLSRSSTSLMAAVVVIALLALLIRSPAGFRPWVPYLVGGLVLVLLAYTLAILQLIPGLDLLLGPVSALTGKDLTFTGRTEIWAVLSQHIRLHPILGTGYGAYWSGPGMGSPSDEFLRLESFYPGSAHNGYLEIVNDLGMVGLLVLIAWISTWLWQCLALFSTDRNQAALYLGLLIQQALTNLSETHWFSVLSVDFVIMALATTALARGLLERQLRALPGLPAARARTW
jgi:O-antigen ligase